VETPSPSNHPRGDAIPVESRLASWARWELLPPSPPPPLRLIHAREPAVSCLVCVFLSPLAALRLSQPPPWCEWCSRRAGHGPGAQRRRRASLPAPRLRQARRGWLALQGARRGQALPRGGVLSLRGEAGRQFVLSVVSPSHQPAASARTLAVATHRCELSPLPVLFFRPVT
jgi:hypothetical protein